MWLSPFGCLQVLGILTIPRMGCQFIAGLLDLSLGKLLITKYMYIYTVHDLQDSAKNHSH